MAGRIAHASALLLLSTLLLTVAPAADGAVIDLVSSDDSGITVSVTPGDLTIEPVVNEHGTFTAVAVKISTTI